MAGNESRAGVFFSRTPNEIVSGDPSGLMSPGYACSRILREIDSTRFGFFPVVQHMGAEIWAARSAGLFYFSITVTLY